MISPSHNGAFTLLPERGQLGMRTSVGFLLLAGAINSMIVVLLLCGLPQSHTPSALALFMRAVLFVCTAGIAGAAGLWVYWRWAAPFRSNTPFSFVFLSLVTAAGWVWVPSIVLLSRQNSPASAILSAIGAAILAVSLRHSIAASLEPRLPPLEPIERELFTQSILSPPHEAYGYMLALSIYAACYAIHDRSNFAASLLLAPCAFFIAWRRSRESEAAPQGARSNQRAAWRSAAVAGPAILITFLALMMGVGSANGNGGLGKGSGDDAAKQASRQAIEHAGSRTLGYSSIILWPLPKKKEILAPVPRQTSLFATERGKPLVIRFDGAYWYFQPPETRPGTKSHIAHGDPSALNIQSNNRLPLVMEAHQNLGVSVPLEHIRELEVVVQNRDQRPGAVSMGILLTDSTTRQKPTLFLGQQPVASTQPAAATAARSSETLRFAVPAQNKIRGFDQITVMFFPDVQHLWVSPKIAVEQFDLLPR